VNLVNFIDTGLLLADDVWKHTKTIVDGTVRAGDPRPLVSANLGR
jgi:hypothetical protein